MPDGKLVVYVKPYQVEAAKLAIRMAERQGRKPKPLMVRIANARPAGPATATA
ncbi:MAG TPA: hypothetical protein VFR22_05900 [Nocardioidaceae bacterium]|nr:hypothetical protein [Nocardioidaceae bacterium]